MYFSADSTESLKGFCFLSVASLHCVLDSHFTTPPPSLPPSPRVALVRRSQRRQCTVVVQGPPQPERAGVLPGPVGHLLLLLFFLLLENDHRCCCCCCGSEKQVCGFRSSAPTSEEEGSTGPCGGGPRGYARRSVSLCRDVAVAWWTRSCVRRRTGFFFGVGSDEVVSCTYLLTLTLMRSRLFTLRVGKGVCPACVLHSTPLT